MMCHRITWLEWFVVFAIGVTIASLAYTNHHRRRWEQTSAKNAVQPAEIPGLIADGIHLAASQRAAVEFRETLLRQSLHGEPPNGKPPNLTISWQSYLPNTPQIPVKVEIDYPNTPIRNLLQPEFKDLRIKLISPTSGFQAIALSITPDVARKLVKDLTSAIEEIETREALEKLNERETGAKK